MLPHIQSRSRIRPSRAVLGVAGMVIAGAVVGLPVNQALAQKNPDQTSVKPYVHAPSSFANLVDAVHPAVVSIKVVAETPRTRKRRSWRRGEGESNERPFPDLPPQHPLNQLFKHMPPGFSGKSGPQVPRTRRSQGSGFVISEDGYVVTNNHVIKGGGKITVSFDDKENIPAEVIGTDARTDLALLKIQTKRKYSHVSFSTTPSRVGDWVMAVGNPFGLGGTVTVGVLSARGRAIGSGPYDFLQIDAAVNRGNSGGPTFNMKGEVIGVNTAIYSPSGGNVGIAFAIPAKTARDVIEQLKATGRVQRGWLGVKIQTITDDIASSLGLPEPHGALISGLTDDGPAKKAGLREGDAILTVEGHRIEDSRDLARKIAGYAPNETVEVGVSRGGTSVMVKVKLGNFPSTTKRAKTTMKPKRYGKPKITALKALGLDLVVDKLNDNEKQESVIIRDLDPGSDAARKGLRAGDRIVAVNGEKVASAADVDRIVQAAKNKKRNAVLLTIKRGDNQNFVAVQFVDKG